MTINESLVLIKTLRQRQASLETLRNEVSIREEYYEPKKVREPKYDVKEVDKKVVKLANAILLLESLIKASNATTSINIEDKIKVEDLLAPLE